MSESLNQSQLLDPVISNALPNSSRKIDKSWHESTEDPSTGLIRLSSPTEIGFRWVFATDPAQTASLWEKVRSSKCSVVPPKRDNRDEAAAVRESSQYSGRKGGRRGKVRGLGREKDKAQEVAAETTEPDELSDTRSVPQSAILPSSDYTAVDTVKSKGSRVTSHSPDFERLVLRPRRILIDEGNAIEGSTNPYCHFGTKQPPKGEGIDYRAIDGLDAAEIWLSLTDNSIEQIIEEYDFMTSKQVCEQEYASFATETFLRRQRRFRQTPSDRKWRAERMLQLISPPSRERPHWHPPVSFASNSDDFKFDIRPHCSYWLSLAGFNSAYRSELMGAVYIHENWITCPYFTVEFKKHGQSINQATWQAAAAASVALYNRYLLKLTALKVKENEWTESDKDQLRHYILTFVGAEYAIWIFRASFNITDSTWNGCTMKRLCSSMCTAPAGVRKLERWINEIHRWGLSKHAAGSQVDVKTILEYNDVDISALDTI